MATNPKWHYAKARKLGFHHSTNSSPTLSPIEKNVKGKLFSNLSIRRNYCVLGELVVKIQTKREFATKLGAFVSNPSDFIIGDTLSGSSEPNYNIGKVTGRNTALYAVKIFTAKKIFIVWDIKRHRDYGGARSSLTLSEKNWDKIPTGSDVFKPHYKEMKNNFSGVWEKVYIVGLSHFDRFFSNYAAYMQFNALDTEFPAYSSEAKEQAASIQWLTENERVKYSSSQYQRDKQFRDAVLAAYGHKCAVCRCTVDAILQAAHERGYEVAHTNYDDFRHGICLCANHHLMYDQELIDIDLKTLEIIINEESVKEMPWYREFITTYQGKILGRNGHV